MLHQLRKFGREYLIAWSRLGKDSRAWVVVGRGTANLLYLFWGLYWVLGFVRPRGERLEHAVLHGIVFVMAFVIILLLRQGHRRDDELLKVSFLRPLHASRTAEEVVSGLGEYLQQRRMILILFIIRGAGEVYGGLGDDQTFRQLANRTLIQMALWAKLEKREAEMAALPQGDWPKEQTALLWEWIEQVWLLRWVLGVDEELSPLEAGPTFKGFFSENSTVEKNHVKREVWDVREERDSALLYVVLSAAELVGRGLLPSKVVPREFRELRDRYAGPSSDLLVGRHTIGELSQENLMQFAVAAVARANYTGYLIDLLGSPEIFTYSAWMERRNSN